MHVYLSPVLIRILHIGGFMHAFYVHKYHRMWTCGRPYGALNGILDKCEENASPLESAF